MKSNFKISILLIVFGFIFQTSFSQDIIVKTTGDTIKAKILEVGTNAISFKKADLPNGPTFVENKSDIIMIKFSNGQVQQFSKAIPTQTAAIGSATNSIATNSATSSFTNPAAPNTNTTASQSGLNKIEMIDGKYTINGQKAKKKDVDNYLSKSKNPAIAVPLKAAKLTSKAQKIIKLTSIPTTIGGGLSTLWTGVAFYMDIQRGRDYKKALVNTAMGLVGTLTLPITSKILKKKSGKMYDKLIDMYNLTN